LADVMAITKWSIASPADKWSEIVNEIRARGGKIEGQRRRASDRWYRRPSDAVLERQSRKK
jgi:hypothetical protein